MADNTSEGREEEEEEEEEEEGGEDSMADTRLSWVKRTGTVRRGRREEGREA